MSTLNCCFSCLVLQSTTTKEQKNHCSRVLLKAAGEGSLLLGSLQQTKQKKQELGRFSNICDRMFPWSLFSGWISAVGFPCDLWTSTGTTQKHMSGVRRLSVNKCLLHKYDDWSLGSQHLYKKKSQVQLCTLVTPRPGGRDRRIPEELPAISPEQQRKLQVHRESLFLKLGKYTWHRPLVSMHPYTCTHTHSHEHTEVHVWNSSQTFQIRTSRNDSKDSEF